MTRMSDPHRLGSRGLRANRSTLQARSSLARTLHDRSSIVRLVFLSLVGGCVIPPSLSSNTTDAGLDSPPSILHAFSDQQELTEPGPVLFQQGAPGTINLSLRDTDLGDTLYAFVFVDYNNPDPTPPHATCPPAPPSKSPDRSTVCDITGLCEQADVGLTKGMTIVVFDREPTDSGTPLYQNIAADGLSTDRFFYLKCQASS
jgi:hypothetical protein